MATRIIIDSTADTTPQVRQCCTVVPLTIHFDQEEYIDGVTISHRAFYEKLVETDVMPTTSQPTPAAFAEEYRKIAEAGDDAVVLTVSSKLSGTYQSACIAAMDYPGRITVVDSKSVAIGTGILAEAAIQLVQQGLGAKEIADTLCSLREKVRVIALLDTLEYLKKGGRISKTVAFAGGMLSIKPVAAILDGEIRMLGKARGSRQANNLLAQEIQAAGGVDFSQPVLLGYTGLSDALLEKYLIDSAPLWQESPSRPNSTMIGSVIGTHAGPGAIAAAFFHR